MSVTQVGVKCLLLSSDGLRFLALRRALWTAHQEELFDIPGGRLENGEEPLAGLLRELKEEIGLTPSTDEHFLLLDACNVVATPERHIVRLTYASQPGLDGFAPVLSEEHISWQWLPLAENHGHHPTLNRAIRALQLLRAKSF